MARAIYLSKGLSESERKKKFVCSIRNILLDYDVKAVVMEVECETPIEAAMVFFTKHGQFPTDIHEEGYRDKEKEKFDSLRNDLKTVCQQRDNFSRSMEKAVVERDIAVQQLEKLHEMAKAVVAALTIPLGGGGCD